MLQRAGKHQGIVQHVVNGARFKVLIPKQSCVVSLALGGIRYVSLEMDTSQVLGSSSRSRGPHLCLVRARRYRERLSCIACLHSFRILIPKQSSIVPFAPGGTRYVLVALERGQWVFLQGAHTQTELSAHSDLPHFLICLPCRQRFDFSVLQFSGASRWA